MYNIAIVAFVTIVLLLVSLASSTQGRRISPAPPCDFPAIYNFGDSNSDTGAISAAFWPTPSPYGTSYFGKPAGRISDGRLIVDFIAEHLGLPYLSPYLDSIGTNFRHGANFATAGSTIIRQNESIFENGLSPFSLDIQTVQHYQFKTRTSELYHQARNPMEKNKLPRPQEFSRALYTFDIGQNDLATGFRKFSMPQLRAAIPDIVNQFAAAITRLYEQGARAFWIHNTGPIGCLPATAMYFKNRKPGLFNKYGCIRSQNAMAVEFNKQLKARINTFCLDLRFNDPFKICCGHHKNNVHVWCGQRLMINGTNVFGAACGSPATCVSWDGVHYSQAANQWIANHILNGSFSDPPIPISSACLKR
ncbi:hypothetical protein DH2020_027870 [Rehmannia glutinosa]|uniref:GDSL esterase/lipase n=1 Tax=Rehmannia glutinosa TaxID=99300 RepID=A0ABR0VSZ6_REHGL